MVESFPHVTLTPFGSGDWRGFSSTDQALRLSGVSISSPVPSVLDPHTETRLRTGVTRSGRRSQGRSKSLRRLNTDRWRAIRVLEEV